MRYVHYICAVFLTKDVNVALKHMKNRNLRIIISLMVSMTLPFVQLDAQEIRHTEASRTPFNDGQNMYEFIFSSANVQVD